MNILHSVILGMVEGLTEFLPVSSTAHLIITSRILQISQTEFQKFFEVFIQSGAILAVIVLYLQYILKNKNLVKTITFSFVPTAVIGFVFYKVIKNVFFASDILLIGAMFVVGFVFLLIESLIVKKKIILKKSIRGMNLLEALVIGLFQALAVVPGVSRAGIVMVTMMFLGYKRDESAKYSFLLAVPTILAAGLYDLYKSREIINQSIDYFPQLMTGFIVSFIIAYVVMGWFINYLKNNSLVFFGAYRIILSLILFTSII